jgi:hypothetical protein
VADCPRTRLCPAAIEWSLVQKLACRARCIRSANLLRRRGRIGVHGAIPSYLVSRTSQAAGKSACLLLRRRVDCPSFSDDDLGLERVEGGRRLDGCLSGDYSFSHPVGVECRMVGHLLRIAFPALGLARNRLAVGSNSGHRHLVLANLNLVRRASSAVPGVGYLCHLLECSNLALESSAFE